MKYIPRDIEHKITALNRDYSCLLITGPRQVGKSTVLEHLMKPDRKRVTLDDLQERSLARRDPAMFLQIHDAPVMIDEVQYAPELFPYIKIAIDNGAPAGSFWLTGSRMFTLMEPAQESLAGRTVILQMTSLSQHEIYGSGANAPFTVSLPDIKSRAATHASANLNEVYTRIWQGAMPGHVSGKSTDRDVFYSSYLATYIDRDVSEEIEGVDKLLFHDFVRAAACRVSQMLNVHDIAKDVGVTDATAKNWLSVLEKSGVIFYLRPYSNNLLQRTVKTPKLYFFDTGLVTFLTRYSTPDILANGAINGAILENYVVAELRKSWLNDGKDCPLWYYQDKDSNEIDAVLESDGQLHPLEIKRSVNPGTELTGAFKILDKSAVPRGMGAVLCMREELTAIDQQNLVVPVWMI
ncbi:MAG: ATP-binding protein [Lachnospiraceae bacterium]|nr:ATP-binding protein [Lachnospiraceae bacterium]